MKQEQSIGSNHQQQTLPNRNEPEDTREQDEHNKKPAPVKPDRPAITDDFGNVVDKEDENSGKGYNETKPMEPGPKTAPDEPKVANRQAEVLEAGHHEFAEQRRQEDEKAREKRVRQSEDVAG